MRETRTAKRSLAAKFAGLISLNIMAFALFTAPAAPAFIECDGPDCNYACDRCPELKNGVVTWDDCCDANDICDLEFEECCAPTQSECGGEI